MEVGTLVKTPVMPFESYEYTYGGMQGGMMNDSPYNRNRWWDKLGIVTRKLSSGEHAFPNDDIVAVFFPQHREVLYIKAKDLIIVRVPKEGEEV